MVGTSNLGSWNGHWYNGLYKSATKNIRLFFFNKNVSWPMATHANCWPLKKRAFSCVLYIYLNLHVQSFSFIGSFPHLWQHVVKSFASIILPEHGKRFILWCSSYGLVLWLPQIIHVQTSLIPKKRKPPYPDPKIQSTISIYISSYPHEIYRCIYVNQYVITDLLLW